MTAARTAATSARAAADIDYFGIARTGFTSAAAAAGVTPLTIRLGGCLLRFNCAGPVAGVLQLPFAHAMVDEIDPLEPVSLTVSLWDSASSGAPSPLDDLPQVSDVHGAVGSFDDGRRRFRWWPHRQLLMAHDADAAEGWWWIADAATTPWYERAAPFRSLLHWWSLEEGLSLLHAAAVGTAGGCVLLGGRSGSGKSTTSLACLASPLVFVGDDYVLLEPGTPPRIHSLYGTAKVEPSGAWRIPHAAAGPVPGGGDDGKYVADVDGTFPGKMASDLAARALLIPRITETAPRLTSLSRAEALRAVAPSSVLQGPSADASTAFHAIVDLVQRVPVFSLELGPDPMAVPPLILEFLERDAVR